MTLLCVWRPRHVLFLSLCTPLCSPARTRPTHALSSYWILWILTSRTAQGLTLKPPQAWEGAALCGAAGSGACGQLSPCKRLRVSMLHQASTPEAAAPAVAALEAGSVRAGLACGGTGRQGPSRGVCWGAEGEAAAAALAPPWALTAEPDCLAQEARVHGWLALADALVQLAGGHAGAGWADE